MNTIELARIRAGDWVRWTMPSGATVDGKVRVVRKRGILIDWDDGHHGEVTIAYLLRNSFEVLRT